MRYGISLIFLFIIIGCGSGDGTNPSADENASGLSISASVTPSSISVDSWASDCTVPPDGTIDQKLSTHTGTLNVTVYDIYKKYTNVTQGVTFTRYTISYSSNNPNAIALASRTVNENIQIPLAGANSATLSKTVEVVELETKTAFRNGWTSQSLPISYTVTMVFYGKDWLTNSDIKVTVTTEVEIGDFC